MIFYEMLETKADLSDDLEGELMHGIYLPPPGLPLRLLPLLLKLLWRQLFPLKNIFETIKKDASPSIYLFGYSLGNPEQNIAYLQPHFGLVFVFVSSHDKVFEQKAC